MRKRDNARWRMVGAATLVVFCSVPVFAARKSAGPPASKDARILVFDNSDSDFRNPPFDDTVLFVTREGTIAKRIGGFNSSQQIGGSRPVTASQDGRFFVVCENVGDKITAYETSTGEVLWSLPGTFTAAAISDDIVYALKSDGTIYGSGLVAIDKAGKIIKQSKAGGFDIAVDRNAGCIWLVGGDIKKCDMNLKVIWKIDPIAWCASSVDLNPDGSVWVAEREHVNAGGINRLLRISPKGTIVQSIPMKMSPMCVRVDRSNGSVWTTGIYMRTTTWPALVWQGWRPRLTKREEYDISGYGSFKFSAKGELLLELKEGGWCSIDLDPADGSVWIAGKSRLLRYSREGKKIGTYRGVSDDQKWISVIPAEGRPSGQSSEDAP